MVRARSELTLLHLAVVAGDCCTLCTCGVTIPWGFTQEGGSESLSGPQRHHGQPAMQAEGWGKGSGLPEARQETTSFLQTPVPPPHLPTPFPSLLRVGFLESGVKLQDKSWAFSPRPPPTSPPAIRLGGSPPSRDRWPSCAGWSPACWGRIRTGEHSLGGSTHAGEHSLGSTHSGLHLSWGSTHAREH